MPPLSPEKRAPFPNLNNNNHNITSEESFTYNCFAWAVSDSTRRWDPTSEWYFWPDNVPSDLSLESFIILFGSQGYEECPNSELELGYEKVSIYTKGGIPTHAARQLESGKWTSKLGDWEDIEHESLEAIEGGSYGSVGVVLRRLRS